MKRLLLTFVAVAALTAPPASGRGADRFDWMCWFGPPNPSIGLVPWPGHPNWADEVRSCVELGGHPARVP